MSDTGVIFDFDGVIVDSEGLQFASYAEAMRSLGVEIDAEEYEREWIAAGQGPEYAVRHYQLPIEADELRRRKDPIYQEMLRQKAALMPGVAERLPALAASFPLALATNSNLSDTSIVLDAFELWPHFRAVVTREDYRARKPAPDAFTTAAERLGVPPRRCVVVEDATKGVQAALAAGCPCVVIPHSFTRRNDFTGAARTLASMDELSADLIRELVGGAATPVSAG